jgi:hypothetical protein
MMDIPLPVRCGIDFSDRKLDRTTSGFRIVRVLDRTAAVLSRNFPLFFAVTAIAQVPNQLLTQLWISTGSGPHPPTGLGSVLAAVGLGLTSLALGTLGQAVVLYAALAQLRGRRVNLTACLHVGWRRFFPACFVLPALSMWLVAMPACVVIERRGLVDSVRRSLQLTKGHRGKIFGLMISLFALVMVVSEVLGVGLQALGGADMKFIGTLLWRGMAGAVSTIAVAATYDDLRVIQS